MSASGGRASAAPIFFFAAILFGVAALMGLATWRLMTLVGPCNPEKGPYCRCIEANDSQIEMVAQRQELEDIWIVSKLVGDRSIIRLADAPRLKSIVLTAPNVTDKSLEALARAPAIQSLSVASPHITMAGLIVVLQQCKTLNYLAIEEANLTEERGVQNQSWMSASYDIQHLLLGSCRISHLPLTHFPNIKRLRHVSLDRSNLSDEAWEALWFADGIDDLSVNETSFSDSHVTKCKRLASLKTISLKRTKVTHQGLRDLCSIPSLRAIYISSDQFSRSAIDEANALNPELSIHFEK